MYSFFLFIHPPITIHFKGCDNNKRSPTYKVGNAVQVTAHRQEDDGPFRVGEPLRIQQKGQDRQRGGQEAQHRPHRHPGVCEDFGPSSVEPAVVAALQGAALGLF